MTLSATTPSPQSQAEAGSAPKAAIRAKAAALGFSAVGFAPADLGARPGQGLENFLAQGYHGDMAWLANRKESRAAPNRHARDKFHSIGFA